MPPLTEPGELSALGGALRALLPDAELRLQAPSLVPELRLWLLADTLGGAPLEPAVINRIMEDPPYWSFCWASGQVLARLLLDEPARVRGRTVVDLGSGSAVVALAAAHAGASRVIACDLDARARSVAILNARENALMIEVAETLEECPDGTDLFTAADILYDRENMPLLETLRRRGEVLLADSRIRDLDPPGYRYLGSRAAVTWPDLDESREYGNVRLFHAAGEQGRGGTTARERGQ